MATFGDRINFWKAKIDKNYKFERLRTDCYKYNEYKYSYYTNRITLINVDVYTVKSN